MDASTTSAVAPDEGVRAELLKLPDILAESPGPEIIEERLAEMASAEAEEPEVFSTYGPDGEHPNKSKWYGLAALASRIYELLNVRREFEITITLPFVAGAGVEYDFFRYRHIRFVCMENYIHL